MTIQRSGVTVRRVSALTCFLLLGQFATAGSVSDRSGRPAVAAFATMPMAIVPNIGQAAHSARYLGTSLKGSVAFERSGPTLRLTSVGAEGRSTLRVAARFVGFAEVEPTAGEPLAARFNYLYGNDPSKWIHDAPSYREVSYRGVYPGIDAVFDGTQQSLKATWHLAPGASPAAIRWKYEGAAETRLGSAGTVEVVVRDGSQESILVERAPVAWQGEGTGRVAVEATFTIESDGVIAFALGTYDPPLPLVIDPTLEWSTYFGGGGTDYGFDVACDNEGFAYVTGFAHSNDGADGGTEPLPLFGSSLV